MPIAAGSRLGPYEILGAIGAGGMGEVYRARDSRLDRDVAIKALPEALANDPERAARFEREAKVLASLNHPHIGAIYGLEEVDRRRYLILEFVDGPTLADRMTHGPLPLSEMLPIAHQIAEALEAAHEAGIVHRDLKPANVKVREDGTVKVLDFGLAKALDPLGASGATPAGTLANSPTLTSPAAMTGLGTILGTAAYMSPEQARGKAVDKRADIWAFGVILYELLTGRRLFDGAEATDVLAALLRQDVDWTALPQGTPPALRRLMERCLSRDARQRLRDIGEARIAIAAIESGDSDARDVTAPATGRRQGRERVAWILVAVLTLAFAAFALFGSRYLHGQTPGEPARFPVETPPMLNTAAYSATISPDGRTIAYVALTDEGKTLLFVRPVDSLDARPLAGTEGAVSPFWSPDSRYIGFSSSDRGEGSLKKVLVTGGPPEPICAMDGPGTWSANGTIVFAGSGGLFRVPAAGGEPMRLTTPDPSLHETLHGSPSFLRDGRRFLYLAWSDVPEHRAVYVGSLDSSERTRIMTSESKALYAPPGFLLFQRQGTLVAQRFDDARLTFLGDPVSLAEGVLSGGAARHSAFAVSATGTLVYRSGALVEPAQLAWFDRQGRRLEGVGQPGLFRTFALSPDEKTVALQRFEPGASRADIWTLEISTGILSRLTTDPADDNEPAWSPDSRTVMFASYRGDAGRPEVFQRTLGSREDVRVFGDAEGPVWPDDWSQDFILVNRLNRDILALPATGDGKPLTLFQARPTSTVDEAQFSPDQRWIAYAQSDSRAAPQVFVASFPEFKHIKQVSDGGGNEPHWSRDGKELFYLTSNGQMMAVEVRAVGTTLETTTPSKLFDTRVVTTTPWSQVYAVSKDGRFLVLNSVQDSRPTPITVVMNWAAGIPH